MVYNLVKNNSVSCCLKTPGQKKKFLILHNNLMNYSKIKITTKKKRKH